MAKKTLQIVAILAAVALAGLVGFSVAAAGGGSGDEDGGFLQHLHAMGHHLHHGDHHDFMAQLIEQLELTPDQQQHLDKAHGILEAFGSDGHASLIELHEQLVGQVEQGDLETDAVRAIVDEHLEQIRSMAYGVTDELIALVNGLDATQRESLLAHLREHGEDHHG